MTSEIAVDSMIVLEHPRLTGGVLHRNNAGAYQDKTGRWVRYGLANDSAKMNEYIKWGDRVGITPKLITAADIGTTVGIYTMVEVKESGWTFPNETNVENYKHCVAQQRAIDLVLSMGGYAGFATGLDDLHRILRLKL